MRLCQVQVWVQEVFQVPLTFIVAGNAVGAKHLGSTIAAAGIGAIRDHGGGFLAVIEVIGLVDSHAARELIVIQQNPILGMRQQ